MFCGTVFVPACLPACFLPGCDHRRSATLSYLYATVRMSTALSLGLCGRSCVSMALRQTLASKAPLHHPQVMPIAMRARMGSQIISALDQLLAASAAAALNLPAVVSGARQVSVAHRKQAVVPVLAGTSALLSPSHLEDGSRIVSQLVARKGGGVRHRRCAIARANYLSHVGRSTDDRLHT